MTCQRPIKTQKTSTYFKCQIICVQLYQSWYLTLRVILMPPEDIGISKSDPRPFKTQKTSTYFKCQIICVQSYQMVPYPSCYILVPHQKILAFQNLIQVHSKPQTTLAGELYSCQITHVQYIKWYLILGVTCNSEDISM